MSAMGNENPLLREERARADAERAADAPAKPGTWTAILGALLAVLAPLVGFLTGTIFGVQSEGPFGLPWLWIWMFVGLVVGGIGGIAAIIGIVRLTRGKDGKASGRVLLGDFADAGGYDAHGRIIARDERTGSVSASVDSDATASDVTASDVTASDAAGQDGPVAPRTQAEGTTA